MENFEGPEKKLEVILSAPQTGLRDNSDRRWDRVVRACGAEIIRRECGVKLDSYLLSESSLFVWNDRILLITCGKTTPSKALPIILEYVAKAQIAYLFYERKNLNFPDEQPTDFNDDVDYLRSHLPGSTIRIGPASRDHIHVFYHANPNGRPLPGISLQILMHEIDPGVGKCFYHRRGRSGSHSTVLSRILPLDPKMDIDNHFFYPQGYSLNGICEANYLTLHVTPQPEASYVSFESNILNGNTAKVIEDIISFFNPLRYSVVLTTWGSGRLDDMFDPLKATLPGYQAVDHVYHQLDRCYTTAFSNFSRRHH